jgi:hypothetical protein
LLLVAVAVDLQLMLLVVEVLVGYSKVMLE